MGKHVSLKSSDGNRRIPGAHGSFHLAEMVSSMLSEKSREMAQRIKALAAEPVDLSWILRAHMVAGENPPHRVVMGLPPRPRIHTTNKHLRVR